jgi:hypothetical protein
MAAPPAMMVALSIGNRTETDSDTGKEVERTWIYGFTSAPVFGFSQTDGDPLPAPDPTVARWRESLPLSVGHEPTPSFAVLPAGDRKGRRPPPPAGPGTGGATPGKTLLCLFLPEQPSVNVIRDSAKSIIFDSLAVDGRHIAG